MFTEKAKEQFEDFFIKTYYQEWNDDINQMYEFVEAFYTQPADMQWGVYQAFADSENVFIEVYRDEDGYNIDSHGDLLIMYSSLDTRPEARTEAIKQLNEYLNK